MAKSRSKKQPEFNANELDDLIFSPAVGSGVGSHLVANQAEVRASVLPFPAPAIFEALQRQQDTEYKHDSNSAPDSNLLPDKKQEPIGAATNSLPDSDLLAAHSLEDPEPDSNLLSGSNLQPDSSLLPDSGLHIDDPPIETNHPNSNVPSGSNLLSGSDLPSEEEPALPLQSTTKRLTTERFSLTDEPGSNLLSGSDLRTANGRVVRIRPARSVQDAHTNGEQLLLTHMWKKGTAETEDTRLLKVGLSELARWCGSHKTSCRAYVRALIAKLAVEEAETFNAAAGSEGARVYRIFSFNTILERRRRANLTHVIRTGAVSFVDPKTGEKLFPGSSLLPGSKLLPDSTLQPGSGSNHPTAPGSNHPPLIKNKKEVLLRTSAVAAAMSEYGQSDDDAVSRLIQACKSQASDCSTDEIVDFIHSKGALTRSKNIQNPIGFLIESVPKCFAGDAFRLRRLAVGNATLQNTEDDAERQKEWGREHASQLDDPTVPESVKDLIRKCLAG
jgi:hypothetical protein